MHNMFDMIILMHKNSQAMILKTYKLAQELKSVRNNAGCHRCVQGKKEEQKRVALVRQFVEA